MELLKSAFQYHFNDIYVYEVHIRKKNDFGGFPTYIASAGGEKCANSEISGTSAIRFQYRFNDIYHVYILKKLIWELFWTYKDLNWARFGSHFRPKLLMREAEKCNF